MLKLLALFTLWLLMLGDDFKTQQMRYERVRDAYEHTSEKMLAILKEKGINPAQLRLFFRVFKKEQIVEIWAKNASTSSYQLLISYPFAGNSGKLGPKRKQGDMQIPEGFYTIERYNPISNFHLSLGVSYPNASDKVLGEKGNLGGDIFIHGATVTVGCIPLTDAKIEEVYLLAVEARNAGQAAIAVHIFPTRLDSNGMKYLENLASSEDFVRYWSIMKGGKPIDSQRFVRFWQNLKTGYDAFEINKTLPTVRIDKEGKYLF